MRISFVKPGRKRLHRSFGGDAFVFTVMLLFAIFSIWPLIFILNNAFKPFDEIFLFPPKLFVRNPTLSNFTDLVNLMQNSRIPFFRYFFNTFFVVSVGTFGHVIFASMAAYPLSKYQFPGRNFLFNLVVLSLMFSSQVTGLPNYLIMSRLGLIDSYAAVIIPVFALPLGLYLMKQFMEQIPFSLIESAKLDGASEYLIYRRIIMPLVKPAWLTLMILLIQQLWRSGGVGAGLFIYSEELKTMGVAFQQIVSGGITRTGAFAAASLIMLIIPITAFVITQSKVIETMAVSGMKE